jgi:hypothetical protein
MFIKCINIPEEKKPFQRLIVGNSYLLVGIEYDDEYRIVNEDQEPILYPKSWFEQIDIYPKDWIKTEYSDGQFFIYPLGFSERCFFAKWFDKDPIALRIFDEYLKKEFKTS